MKKRLLSLLVAISMVLTFLPVSALTAAAAEDSSNGELKIGQDCYPVLNNIPHQTVNEHDIYTGDGWTYDADENCKILTLCPSAPTNYDFFAIHVGHSITTDCNLVIGENATVTDGNFIASVTNNGTIKGGIFKDAVTNHGTIIGGRFFSSVTNELDGIIENGQFGDWASSYTVTNNGGTINGGTFKEMSSIRSTGSVASGYTLAAETPSVFSSVSVNGYHNSCYIIPNQASVSVDISYRFDDTMYDLPPLDVTIDSAQHMLLSDWCVSDLKIEFEDIRGVYEVTFTAPPANGSTVTISPLTRLVIEKSGYPAVAQDWNGNRANYTGDGWKFENNSLILEPTAEKSYDFTSPGILETAAMIGVAGTGVAVLGYTGYMIGTELYLNTVLPAGAAIPNNAGELALLLWEAAGTPAPAALLPADAAPVQQALAWAIENQLLAPDASAEDSVSRWEVIRSWNQLKG